MCQGVTFLTRALVYQFRMTTLQCNHLRGKGTTAGSRCTHARTPAVTWPFSCVQTLDARFFDDETSRRSSRRRGGLLTQLKSTTTVQLLHLVILKNWLVWWEKSWWILSNSWRPRRSSWKNRLQRRAAAKQTTVWFLQGKEFSGNLRGCHWRTRITRDTSGPPPLLRFANQFSY